MIPVFVLFLPAFLLSQPSSPASYLGNYKLPDGKIISIGFSSDEPSALFLMQYGNRAFKQLLPKTSNTFCSDNCESKVTIGPKGLLLEQRPHRATKLESIGLKTEDVRYENDGLALAGKLWLPAGSERTHPAIVLIGGSGKDTRDDFRAYPYFLVLHGFAVLTFDKRGSGQSGGDHQHSEEGIRVLAGDVTAAIHYLRSRPDIEIAHVGVMGFSHGAWVADEVAGNDANIGFLIPIVGGGVPQWQAQLYDTITHLREDGFVEAQVLEAQSFMERLYALAGVGDYPQIKKLLDDSSHKVWIKKTPVAPLLNLPSEQVSAIASKIWRDELSYDPQTSLSKVHCPVLAFVAERDEFVPPKENADALEKILKSAGNLNFKIQTLPNANHWQNESPHYAENFVYAKGLFETMGLFLDELKTSWTNK